jgi:hypothetical protein
MKILKYIPLLAIIFSLSLFSQWEEKGDTIIVQTLSYDSITTRSGTWQFPPDDSYEKILMHYSLKCDPRTTRDGFECGEWDYLTYTVVTDSSGAFDSTNFSSPGFRVRGASPQVYRYTTEPYNYKEIDIVYESGYGDGFVDVMNANIDTEGDNDLTLANKTTSFQIDFSYSPEELDNIASNLGQIHAIKLHFLDDVKIENFSITLVDANSSSTGSQIKDGTERFLNDIEVDKDTEHEFILYSPHNINNSTGLQIVLKGNITEGNLSVKAVDESTQKMAGIDYGARSYLKFSKGSYVEVPKEAFEDLGNEITIGFWQYGDEQEMPQNSYAFEGVNAQNQRVLNSHLPWSNSQVYWDAGNAGGSYDRINKAASPTDFKGQWNYWIFTKNVNTGDMKMYLNGELFHEGTQKSRGFDQIEKFRIASNINSYGLYDGSIDNFGIWNRVLTPTEIEAAMNLDFITNQNATIANGALVYYDMNNIVDGELQDATGNGNNATLHGMPEIRTIDPSDMLVGDNQTPMSRPYVIFSKANFADGVNLNKKRTEVYREYPVPMDEILIFDYESKNGIIAPEEIADYENMIKTPTSVMKVYPANKKFYTYDSFGLKVDSVMASLTDSITNREILYYSPVVNYEIHRFITPYGIGLDLGPDGFTWVEDVTDFGPILKDFVKLRAGNQQELIDLKFLFIKGTPARDVKSVQQLWGKGGTFQNVVDDVSISSLEIAPNPDASMFRVLTRSSGHGFNGPQNTGNCSEFCKRTHQLFIGETGLFEWEGWKECGDNPVFPQGGTWQIDRSDWCPGATVNTYEHEITDLVTAGETIPVDYNIVNPSGFVPYGNYQFTGYMIGYGDPNFGNDISVERIISPSMEREFGRINPICAEPSIIIKNNGSETLESATIEYGLANSEKAQYAWNGSLGFLEEEVVSLPPIDISSLSQGKTYSFEVNVSGPNGETDEYERNNYAVSQMQGVDVLSSDFELNIRTNRQAGAQYKYLLRKADGEIIDQMDLGEFDSEKLYEFEYDLELGCYELLFENVEGFGLDLWWMRDQLGTGYINYSSGNGSKTFNPDFGNFIKYQFSVGTKPEIAVSSDLVDFGFASSGERVEKSMFVEPSNEKSLILYSVEMGIGAIKGMSLVSPTEFGDGIVINPGEKQEIVFAFEPKNDDPREHQVSIRTNSDKKPSYQITLSGNQEITSVEENEISGLSTELLDNGASKELVLDNSNESLQNLNIKMFNSTGQLLSNLYNGVIGNNTLRIPLNLTNLYNGVYYIKIDSNKGSKTLKFIEIR